MILRPYQKEIIDKIIDSKDKRNFVSLGTGAGKTVIFSHLAKEHNGKVLILVNRVELLEQTFNTIKENVAKYDAKTKQTPDEKIIVAMVMTVRRRPSFNINNFDLVIVDEAHYFEHVDAIKKFKGRLIGFSATPITNKTLYFEDEDGDRWKKKESLSKYYGPLITGIDIKELIEQSYLVDEKNFVIKQDLTRLKTDRSGEFTNESLDKLYQQKQSVESVYKNYKEHSFNKKTLIFSSSIKINNSVFDYFVSKGVNCKKYDSNSDGRKELVEWFRNTPDAVLLNVSVFVAGFDVDDVETIILNRATTSLSMYIQICGRGSRTTTKVFKPYFNIIDLGNNFYRFGKWSSPRNWTELYNDNELKRVTFDLMDVVTCEGCDAIILKTDPVCEYCGLLKPTIKKKVKKESFEIAVPVNKFEWCSASQLMKYAIKNELTISEALKMVEGFFIESVVFNGVKLNPKNNIEIVEAIYIRFRPFYFAIINSSLSGSKKRKLMTLVYSIYDKIIKL